MFALHNLPNKVEGERLIQVIRKDVFLIFKKILFFVALTVLPFFFLLFLFLSDLAFMDSVIAYPLAVLGTSAYYLFIWVLFVFSFVDYYLDVWIITTERIIDIEQRGFFSRIVSEHKLSRIQDVTSEVHGFFPTILHFGDCHVQTAGAVQRFIFEDVPNPEKIRNTIIGLIEKNKHNHGTNDANKRF